MSLGPFQYAKDLREPSERLKSLIQFGNNVAPLDLSVHKPEHNLGLYWRGWFDFKAMMRSKGERRVDGSLQFWMQYYWAVKEEKALHILAGLSSLRGWLAGAVQTGFCLKSHDTERSHPTVSTGGKSTQFCLHAGASWEMPAAAEGKGNDKRKCSVHLSPWSFSPSPPGPYLKYLEVDGGSGLLEAVSSAPMRAASLGLIGLWFAPYSTQREAVLHSWGLCIFHTLRCNCLKRSVRSNSINMERCLKKWCGDWKSSASCFISAVLWIHVERTQVKQRCKE